MNAVNNNAKPKFKKRARRLADGSRMPTFFAQHHQALADIMKAQRPFGDVRADLAWDAQVRALAHALAHDNVRFDTERFLKEAGPLPTDKGGDGE